MDTPTGRSAPPQVAHDNHGHAASLNVVHRDFGANGPNRMRLCEITYIPMNDGLLYLAGVMDAWRCSIVK